MTIDDVRERIAKIAAIQHDDEKAHGEEDDLWRDVLEAIATGRAENAQEMARLALTTQDLDFARWCA